MFQNDDGDRLWRVVKFYAKCAHSRHYNRSSLTPHSYSYCRGIFKKPVFCTNAGEPPWIVCTQTAKYMTRKNPHAHMHLRSEYDGENNAKYVSEALTRFGFHK